MYKKTISLIMVLLLFVTIVAVAADETGSEQEENIAAVVDGETITMNELNGFINIQQLLSGLYQVDQTLAQVIFNSEEGQEVLNKYRESKLEQLIINKLLINKAHEEINMTQEEKDKSFNDHISKIKEARDFTDEELLKELQKQGINSLEEYKSIYINQLIFNEFQQKVLADVTVSEDSIKNYYETNKTEFEEKEKVDVSHILFRTENRSDEEAKVEAEKIIKRLNDGEDFAELAKEYSEGPSSENGGGLGYVSRTDVVSEFAEAAFNMKVGEISEPVKTNNGFHIIKVNDKKESSIKPLSDVKDTIENRLLNDKKNQAWSEYVRNLRDEADENGDVEIKL